MYSRIKNYLGDLSRKDDDGAPVVSLVVIVYDMPAQAEITLRSLLPSYQIGANTRDYEVIVVENRSAHLLDQNFVRSLPDNFSYYLRDEDQPTPIHAIDFGAARARGDNICLMIDGARLLTPGVIRNIIRAHCAFEDVVVAVPGYHLGSELQQDAVGSGYSVEHEQAAMESIAWPKDGYRLFDIACLSGSCAGGIYLPISESNCISMPRGLWDELGGCDKQFDLRGGGLVNLDLYKRACETPGVTHFILHGEGTFHQFHGGVTTGGQSREVREEFIATIMQQYEDIRGQAYESPQTDPVYFGELSRPALKFIHYSCERSFAGQASSDSGDSPN